MNGWWPFHDMPPLSYEVIVSDPPWRFETYSETNQTKSAATQYALMSTADIKALPVGRLAQRDAILLLWVIAPMLPEGLAVMSAWGFTYKTNIVWRKTTVNGKVRVGPGYRARSMHESILIGTVGEPRQVAAFPSLFDGLAREHSRKPDEFYALVNRCTDGLRRADLFARQTRPGFDAWGDEKAIFDEAAT